MTYKQQMEKAIKNYLASVGFKYYAPRYVFLKRIDDDTVCSIIYGHYIQSQWLSALYFPIIAIPSLCSAARICKVDHDRRWFEVSASKLGSRYFDKRYGSGAPGYKKGDSNYFDLDSFMDERKKSPYKNPRFNIVNTQKTYPISGEIYTIWDFLIL